MPTETAETAAIDWSLTTWEGARREQLRRWSALTLEEIVRAQEDMQDLADRLSRPPPPADSSSAPSGDGLSRLSVDDLVERLIADEDRAGRDLIDECAGRGQAMLDRLGALLHDERFWGEDLSSGEWWLRLHAVMILGLIPGERAGLLLVAFMRRIGEVNDENLQDWLAGYWPALFRDKTDALFPELRAVCEDRGFDWYVRAQALDAAVSMAQLSGEEPLEAALAWSARIAADESEEWDMRLYTGNTLLNFPRDAYRPLLEDLAARQPRLGAHFRKQDVEQAYTAGQDKPDWERFRDPWEFYSPAAIEHRQRRWKEEDARSGEDDLEDEDLLQEEPMMLPYVRETPKIGRNDPCPCGSGKKYKKCCFSA
jgi:hypothetical protein